MLMAFSDRSLTAGVEVEADCCGSFLHFVEDRIGAVLVPTEPLYLPTI
jgi:hypothetical protein